MSLHTAISSKLNVLKHCCVSSSILHSLTRKTTCSNIIKPLYNESNRSCNILWPTSQPICYSVSLSQMLNIQGYKQWPIKSLLGTPNQPFCQVLRTFTKVHHVDRPSPETCRKNLRYRVHYPEDGEYTIKPLRMTKLAGRDPETGRIIFGRIGGGHKRRYRWVILDRLPLLSKDPLVEKVVHVQYDPNRSARIALVGHDDKLRFIIATTSMKKGDLITSTRQLPKMPIRAKEGDAHPIGALTTGTRVCCIEKRPGCGASFKVAAGTSALIVRKLDQKMVVQVDSYKEFALDPNCLVTVGQVSIPITPKKPIGSAQRLRWLGIRPASGLWQKKTGRFGFRKRTKQPVKHIETRRESLPLIKLTVMGEGPSRRVIPATNRVS